MENKNQASLEVINTLNEYIKNIRNNMVIGDTYIIYGVNVVKDIITKLNVETLTDEFIYNLEEIIKMYCKNLTNREIIVNKYVKYGIYISINIIKNNYKLNKIKIK